MSKALLEEAEAAAVESEDMRKVMEELRIVAETSALKLEESEKLRKIVEKEKLNYMNAIGEERATVQKSIDGALKIEMLVIHCSR